MKSLKHIFLNSKKEINKGIVNALEFKIIGKIQDQVGINVSMGISQLRRHIMARF